jgi:CRISPR-associated protein Csb2
MSFAELHSSTPIVTAFVPPQRAHSKPPPVLAHVRLEFDEEVRGPVMLGRQRYLGIGLFHPFTRGERV